jgi:integrase
VADTTPNVTSYSPNPTARGRTRTPSVGRSPGWSKTLDVPRIRFHDLRHTHATHLLAAGVNAKLVSEPLGHSTVAFTSDTYGHVQPGQQADAAALAAGLVDGL